MNYNIATALQLWQFSNHAGEALCYICRKKQTG